MAIKLVSRGEGGHLRSLVCCDERHIVRLIQINFERLGHEVVCAFSGGDAIELLEHEVLQNGPGFDLLVIDAVMPGVDGYEVLTWVRTHEMTEKPRVVMITANAREIEGLQDRLYQADKYLSKPFHPLDLLR